MAISFSELIKRIGRRILFPITNRLRQLEINQLILQERLNRIQEALGRVESRQVTEKKNFDFHENEFRVFSQWGEDGIIQFLINNIDINRKIFVEFGVENYQEANTRFLLVNNNWSGLVLDSSQENIEQIRGSKVYWNYNLKAVQAFITRDNINAILSKNGITGEIGLLSIDIDGNDYWVWKEIDTVHPIIVIAEYNYRFGEKDALVVPYTEDFERVKAHHSMIYFGASLKALCTLAESKGYDFVGCSSSGVNAFFVRQDKRPQHIRAISVEEGYVSGQFCELRDSSGKLVKTSPTDEIELLSRLNLPIINILKDK